MKLKFERFEGIASFIIRGKVETSQLRLLAIGLETLLKTVEEPLIVNFTMAEIDPLYLKTLIDLKKALGKTAKQKIYWIGKGKGLSDYLDLGLLFSRLGGFKLRQIGERLTLEDQIYSLAARVDGLKAEIDTLGGDGDQAKRIILENITLKEQNKMLKATLKVQEERMKVQTKSSPTDAEYEQKVKEALESLKTAFGTEISL